jgi:hypothetical protein
LFQTIPAILLAILPFSFSLLPSSLHNFIQLIISAIDTVAVAIVLISIVQAVKPFLIYSIIAAFPSSFQRSSGENSSSNNNTNNFTEKKFHRSLIANGYNSSKKSFVKGLLFALELESANAILKMGVFTASSVGLTSLSIQSQTPIQALGGNFLFFVIILSLRITINHTLRRFS